MIVNLLIRIIFTAVENLITANSITHFQAQLWLIKYYEKENQKIKTDKGAKNFKNRLHCSF